MDMYQKSGSAPFAAKVRYKKNKRTNEFTGTQIYLACGKAPTHWHHNKRITV